MAPRKHSTKSKITTARRSTAALDCAEATRCIQHILRITTAAGTLRLSENYTRNGKYENAKKVSKSTSPSRITLGCGFSDRYSLQNTLRNSPTSTYRHNHQLERTQRSASIRSQHVRQEINLNAVAARFMAQHAQKLSSKAKKTLMFELLVREMGSNGGYFADLGALMEAMKIDTSAAELEEMFRDMDIDEEL
ncbi:hypothetical protein RUND412_009952 [Rhizina undulata]